MAGLSEPKTDLVLVFHFRRDWGSFQMFFGKSATTDLSFCVLKEKS